MIVLGERRLALAGKKLELALVILKEMQQHGTVTHVIAYNALNKRFEFPACLHEALCAFC